MLSQLPALLLLCNAALLAGKSYENYKVYDVITRNEFEKELMMNLSHNAAYDFFLLARSLSTPTRVMVQPKDQQSFEKLLHDYNMELSIVSSNLEEDLQRDYRLNKQARSLALVRRRSQSISFTSYSHHAEINAYLDALAKRYPARVSVQTIGKSYEQRELKTITIGNGDRTKSRQVILLDAGMHGREWIAPAAALYVIYQLVENFAAHSTLLKDFDWVVLPVVNPDGYEYSHTQNRLWRKTRKPVSSYCAGTDGNRNFDFHWGDKGAARFSCAEDFKGLSAFSEPETQAVRDLLLSLKYRGKFYLSLHAFGPHLIYPWSWTNSLPDSWRDLEEVAQAGAAAIYAATGTNYTVGSGFRVVYSASGTSHDYAFAIAKFRFSLIMELPADKYFYKGMNRSILNAFFPHSEQILPLVSETWIGIKAMAERVMLKSATSTGAGMRG